MKLTAVVMLMLLGWLVIFLVSEFRVIQRNGDSWEWCRRIYNRFNLGRIRW